MTQHDGIASRAMLISLNIRSWTARKHDRKVSAEVALQHNAREDVGRYHKVLIAKEAMGELVKIQGEARTFFYANTLPWMRDGAAILPSANYFPVTNTLKSLREKFETAADAFCASYGQYKANAKAELNGLYSEDDYPSETRIRELFRFSFAFAPMPSAEDFRVDLADTEIGRIRAEIERESRTAVQQAMYKPFERIFEAVDLMAVRLKEYNRDATGKVQGDKKLRDSMVENIRHLVDVLPRLNLTDDPRLTSLVTRMRDNLIVYDTDVLRVSPKIKSDVQKQAEEIAAETKAIMKEFEGYF